MEWITAREALAMVEQECGAYGAPRAIAKRALAGMVRARARRVTANGETSDNVDIPANFWWPQGEAALEQNWALGDFAVWLPPHERAQTQLRCFGVEFLRADIEDMLPEPDNFNESWDAWIEEAKADPWHNGFPAMVNLMQADAWVQHRSIDAMRAVEIEMLRSPKEWAASCSFVLGGIGKKEIVSACIGGVEGLAFGRPNDGDLSAIPPTAWPDTTCPIEKGDFALYPSDRLTAHNGNRTIWYGLKFDTKKLMEVWPASHDSVAREYAAMSIQSDKGGKPTHNAWPMFAASLAFLAFRSGKSEDDELYRVGSAGMTKMALDFIAENGLADGLSENTFKKAAIELRKLLKDPKLRDQKGL